MLIYFQAESLLSAFSVISRKWWDNVFRSFKAKVQKFFEDRTGPYLKINSFQCNFFNMLFLGAFCRLWDLYGTICAILEAMETHNHTLKFSSFSSYVYHRIPPQAMKDMHNCLRHHLCCQLLATCYNQKNVSQHSIHFSFYNIQPGL